MWKFSACLVAALFAAVPAMAQPSKPAMRICSGPTSGNYHFAASEIGNRLTSAFQVTVIATRGSVANLRHLIANECDVAFVQSDVADLFKLENPTSISQLYTVKTLYSEYVQVICPVAADWSRITHVGKAKGKMIVGEDGSGTAETWRALRKADDSLYGAVERIPDAGITALSQVKDSKDTCMLWVSGLNAPDMQAANVMSINTKDHKPSLTLISVDDRDMYYIKDSSGKPMYRFEKIYRKSASGNQPGMYENLMQSSSVTVPVVDALLIARKDYYDSIKPQMGRVTIAIEDASPTIWKRVNPQQ
jgi:TRAP-type uncharacterized transport system substrate-binding protein